jgi:hypothetical protein
MVIGRQLNKADGRAIFNAKVVKAYSATTVN